MEILIVIGVVVVGIILVFYLSRVRVGSAVTEVVRLFREQGATTPETAVTTAQLGIFPRNLLSPKFGLRDYKPDALRLLTQMGVVKTNDEGLLYLSEVDLEHSRLGKMAEVD